MTKSELITKLYQNAEHFSASDVEMAVNAILDSLNESISSGNRVEIRGFGSFSLHKRAARIGRNPRTGEKVELTKRYSVHFKPGKELRDRVNHVFLVNQ